MASYRGSSCRLARRPECDVTDATTALVVAGPKARDLLAPLTDADVSNKGFPWLTVQDITVAGIDVMALRVNYVGELGWELHVAVEQAGKLYDALVGREALLAQRDAGVKTGFVQMLLDDADPCEAMFGAPILSDGAVVGMVTSGGYGHRLKRSIALGLVNTELTAPGTVLSIDVLGVMRQAEVVTEPAWDPKNERLRS